MNFFKKSVLHGFRIRGLGADRADDLHREDRAHM